MESSNIQSQTPPSTANSRPRSLAGSAGIVAAGTAVSRVTGLIREQVMAYFFGAGMATDAFVVAFRIPNLLRDLFAEGALSSSFVPVFKERLVNASREEAFRLANATLTVLIALLGLITLLGIAATDAIVYLTAHGFADNLEKFELTANMTRIMWVFLPTVSVAALIMGMLNSMDRFGVPALAPALFNIGSIVTVVAFYHLFNTPAYTLAIGVVVGGFAQLAIQLPPLWKQGYRYRVHWNLSDSGLRKMLRLFTPMMIGLSASRINILVSTLLASFLVEGAMSYLNYAYRIMHFPMGVFAVALGTVALPRAAEQASRGENRALADTLHELLSLNLFFIVPSAAALAFLAEPLTAAIYEYGQFSPEDTRATGLAMLHYSYGLIGFAAVRVIAPVFYALGDARRPMFVSLATVALNIALYFPLVRFMSFAGLAAATSIAALFNVAALLWWMPQAGVTPQYGRITYSAARIGLAAAAAFVGAKYLPLPFPEDGTALQTWLDLLMRLLAAGLAYLAFAYLLRVAEVTTVLAKLRGRLKRT